MPPKKKNVNPEQQLAKFNQWKEGEEFKKIQDLAAKQQDIKKNCMHGAILSETTHDITGPWMQYFEELFQFLKYKKTKLGKVKDFKQETMRSFFFARSEQEKASENTIVDGITININKINADAAWTCRQKFMRTFEIIEKMEEEDETTFEQQLADMKKMVGEFVKAYQQHLKVGHKIVYEEKMGKILQPIKLLIDINFEYRMFNLKYSKDIDKKTRDFKLKAITEKYCDYFQEVLRIFLNENEKPAICCAPSVIRIFNKVNYTDWHKNTVEKKYLEPLNHCFDQLQKRLCNMYYKGIDYWKIPIYSNEEVLDDVKALINAELIAERLIGNQLKRDQLNFVYEVIEIIKNSNDRVCQNMIKKDDNTCKKSIPQLIIFKQLQKMRKWKDMKKEDEDKKQNEIEQLAIIKAKKDEEESKSPMKKKDQGDQSPAKQTSPKQISPYGSSKKQAEETEDQRDDRIYGRYWILENYVDENKRNQFEECVEQLRHINQAVQQDIQDCIIREGFTPKIRRGDEEAKIAQQKLEELQEHDNQNDKVNHVRPPYLWNYPKILEKDEHKFRSIANPKGCYIDGRVDKLENNIKELGDHLTNNPGSKCHWAELISRVIDVFADKYEQEPKGIDPVELGAMVNNKTQAADEDKKEEQS